MRAPAPRNARACPAPDARQPRCSVLTTHPTPAIVRSRANLGAQGGLDFLSVVCLGAADRSARDREVREGDPAVVDFSVHRQGPVSAWMANTRNTRANERLHDLFNRCF